MLPLKEPVSQRKMAGLALLDHDDVAVELLDQVLLADGYPDTRLISL